MTRLLAATHGNRRPDPFGNLHTAVDHRGLTVFRCPRWGYRGRHRR